MYLVRVLFKYALNGHIWVTRVQWVKLGLIGSRRFLWSLKGKKWLTGIQLVERLGEIYVQGWVRCLGRKGFGESFGGRLVWRIGEIYLSGWVRC